MPRSYRITGETAICSPPDHPIFVHHARVSQPNDPSQEDVSRYQHGENITELRQQEAVELVYDIVDWTPPAERLGDSIYEPYALQSIAIPSASAHPTPLVQSAAMASVDAAANLFMRFAMLISVCRRRCGGRFGGR